MTDEYLDGLTVMTDLEFAKLPLSLQRLWNVWKEEEDCYLSIEEALKEEEPEALSEFYHHYHGTDAPEQISFQHDTWVKKLHVELKPLWEIYCKNRDYVSEYLRRPGL
jgi:hypothetical protein